MVKLEPGFKSPEGTNMLANTQPCTQQVIWQYEYYLKDHLGNTRVRFADLDLDGSISDDEVLGEHHYYAFGMEMEGAWNAPTNQSPNWDGEDNLYRYNGKELNTDLGLYDYGARYYDPAIARWTAVDNLSELAPDWTPYRYGFNNPILFIDPDGNYETRGQARRAQRRAKRMGYKIGYRYQAEDGEWGFRFGENGERHAFSSTFFGGSKFAQFFARKGTRGGVEMMTGSGHAGSGSIDTPEGTSSAIIDEFLTPFGGGATPSGRRPILRLLKYAKTAVTKAPLGKKGVEEVRITPESEYGWQTSIRRYGSDTAYWNPPGTVTHSGKLPRIIYDDGKPVDTIPAKWDRADTGGCYGCYNPDDMQRPEPYKFDK